MWHTNNIDLQGTQHAEKHSETTNVDHTKIDSENAEWDEKKRVFYALQKLSDIRWM